MTESTKSFHSWSLTNIYRDTWVRRIYFPTVKTSPHDPVIKLAGKSLWPGQTLVQKKWWPRMKSDPKHILNQFLGEKSHDPFVKPAPIYFWRFENLKISCVWHRIKEARLWDLALLFYVWPVMDPWIMAFITKLLL